MFTAVDPLQELRNLVRGELAITLPALDRSVKQGSLDTRQPRGKVPSDACCPISHSTSVVEKFWVILQATGERRPLPGVITVYGLKVPKERGTHAHLRPQAEQI